MKTFGTARLGDHVFQRRRRPRNGGAEAEGVKRKAWKVTADPHVLMRLKRLFERANKGEFGELVLAHTPEVCRELLWFTERYPMKVTPRLELERGAEAHRERERIIEKVLSGGYKPTAFTLAYPPREYQSIAADLLLRSGSLLLADDLGLGKTVSAITALTAPKTLPALVITLTHLPRQWEAMVHKFAPNLSVFVAKSGKPVDLRLGRRTGCPGGRLPDVTIMNYHKLTGWADTLAPLIRTVVFDECQELRTGPGSDKYAAARYVAESATYCLGLSATPVYNYGDEIHHVLSAIAPDVMGTFEEFTREWCGTEGGRQVKDPRALGLHLRDQGLLLRRTRRDVGRELPPVQRVPHTIDSNPEALDQVADTVAELARVILAQGESERGAKMRAGEELSWRLRQATGIGKAPFVADFVRMLVENGEKVVLYGWHREVYSIWESKLAALKPAFYTGEESLAQKTEAVRRFTSGQTPVLVMSLRSGAGVDGLQETARTIVFGELDWSPGVHDQCIGRLHRDGQDEPVVAYFLIADSGSDPVVADVLGLKREQGELIRDPQLELVNQMAQDATGHIRRLAEQFINSRGRAA